MVVSHPHASPSAPHFGANLRAVSAFFFGISLAIRCTEGSQPPASCRVTWFGFIFSPPSQRQNYFVTVCAVGLGGPRAKPPHRFTTTPITVLPITHTFSSLKECPPGVPRHNTQSEERSMPLLGCIRTTEQLYTILQKKEPELLGRKIQKAGNWFLGPNSSCTLDATVSKTIAFDIFFNFCAANSIQDRQHLQSPREILKYF